MRSKQAAVERKPQAPHRLLYARWIDAHALTDSWCPVDGIDDLEARTIESVGWLLEGRKPGHLVLAQSFDTVVESVDHVLAIPIAMVRQLVDLTLGVEHDITQLR